MLTLHFDGMAKPNPGVGAYGWVLERDGKEVATGGGIIGGGSTSNEAEYAGLVQGLRAARQQAGEDEAVTAKGDSRLVVNQASGRWAVRAENLVPLVDEVWELAARLGRVSFVWVPRAQNRRADNLARMAFLRGRAKT